MTKVRRLALAFLIGPTVAVWTRIALIESQTSDDGNVDDAALYRTVFVKGTKGCCAEYQVGEETC